VLGKLVLRLRSQPIKVVKEITHRSVLLTPYLYATPKLFYAFHYYIKNSYVFSMASAMEKQLQAIGIGIGIVILVNAISFFIDVPWVLLMLVTIAVYFGIVYYAIRNLGLGKKEIHTITRGIALFNAILNLAIVYIFAPELLRTYIAPVIAWALISAWVFAYIGIALFKTKETEDAWAKQKKKETKEN
jgi:hypothetical protein